jgi:uncharacterized protein YoxC
MQQEIRTYTEKAKNDITTLEHMQEATSTLSWLNTQLDVITADKETLTKPLNASLKAIRDKYRPTETLLSDAIASIRLAMTSYATSQVKLAKEQEQRILADKRTSIDTKITRLATVDTTATDKVTTAQGSVSFITVKKYRIVNDQEIPRAYLQPNEEAIKEAMKQSPQPQIPGIEWYEEQSLRNYR